MNPQGSKTVNTDAITNLTNQINNINVCAELQALAGAELASINALMSGIQEELNSIAPVIQLLTNPAASIGAIANWISNYITSVLSPQTKPYLTYVSQIQSLIQEVSALSAALENAAARIGNCALTIPSVTVPTVPAAIQAVLPPPAPPAS